MLEATYELGITAIDPIRFFYIHRDNFRIEGVAAPRCPSTGSTPTGRGPGAYPTRFASTLALRVPESHKGHDWN